MRTRAMLWASLLLVVSGITATAAPHVHRDEADHFTFAVPDGWAPLSDEMMERMRRTYAAAPLPPRLKGGWSGAANVDMLYPYFVVTVLDVPPGETTYERIESEFDLKSIQKGADDARKQSGGLLEPVEIEKPALDRTKNRFVMHGHSVVPQVGDVAVTTVGCLGQRGVVMIAFFSPKGGVTASVVDSVVESFRFDAGYEFKEAPSAYEQGRAFGQAVATVVIFAAAVGFAIALGVFLWRKDRAPRSGQ